MNPYPNQSVLHSNKNRIAYPVLNNADDHKMQPSAPLDPAKMQRGVLPSQYMALPDAIQQQVIYQQIMEQQRQQKEAVVLMEEKKQEPISIVKDQPKGSFLAQSVDAPETSVYTASYLCIWRPNENGQGIQIMMGQEAESKLLTFFGGKRINAQNAHPIDTALGAFQEQSGRKLDAETLTQIRKMLASDDERRVFWKSEWKSAMFYYQMSWDYNIVDDFAVNKRWNDEMKTLKWINFDTLFDAVFITGDGRTFSPLVIGMLLHDENFNFLSNAHRRFGGDERALSAVNGGSLRSTMSTFERVPNAVRLDVIHPMTHQMLYRRWMEMEIGDIEDYQLLHSLIASICPEIGTNFLLYFTNNGCFKSSASQYPIDTNPALQTLQKLLAAKYDSKRPQMTVMNVVPTFVLSDHLGPISLSCSRRDISWKVINPTKDDDEKSLASSLDAMQSQLQNQYSNPKPLEFASKWFPVEGIQLDANYRGRWKWQFMNDDNEFQDFAKNNNRIVERLHRKGLSFGTFHRSKVQYQVNFKSMVQKNLKSGNLRTIRRVPIHIKGVAASSSKALRKIQSRPVVDYMKWQFEDEHGLWTDYPVLNSKQLNELKTRCDLRVQSWNYSSFLPQHTMTIQMRTNDKGKWYKYEIDVYSKKQRNKSTRKERKIRQIAVFQNNLNLLNHNGKCGGFGAVRNRWEWRDDDGTFKRYDDGTSAQIETARCSGIKKYFFVSTKNSNSYEIGFVAMKQYNVQSGKQRKVRRIPLEPQWKGPGPNPKSWSGPTAADRRTFGKKVVDLYTVIGAVAGGEVKKSGKFINGSLGPFGGGLYFYDSKEIAIHMAKHRTAGKRGYVVAVKVFVGEEMDVSNLDDKLLDFRTLQTAGKDSVTRSLGFGNEYIVFNADQVCVVKVHKY